MRPDGKTLLVGESKHNRILSYDIISAGKVGKMRVFAKLPVKEAEQIANEPDGIGLDAAGNLYVAHYGMRQVQVLSPAGETPAQIRGRQSNYKQCRFRRTNMDQLYVTGALGDETKSKGGLFRLDLKGVKGLKILQSTQLPVYEVSRTSTAIKVDGKLDDPAWSKAPGTGKFINNSDGSAAAYETEARILYDDNYLYFSFRSRDENIWSTFKRKDARLWEEEVVEVFLQADPSQPSYIELEVNPLGTMLDIYLLDVRKPLRYESWNSEKLKWAVDVDGTVDGQGGDKEWVCEMALPLEDVVTAPRLPPRPGDRWRLNLYRVESRPVPALLAWSPTRKDDFHLPGMFGWIVFTDRQVP